MILPEIISKEPLGPVVRQGDDQWFNIVKWSLFALLNVGEGSEFNIARGLNALWTEGGIQYAPPVR